MPEMIDKRDRASLFRTRLAAAMLEKGESQSGLARKTGVDRSTISALLAPGTRLPNAQLVGDCAQALSVSSDWLLGLSDLTAPPEQVLASAFQIIGASRALLDDSTFGWHQEAAGYKIRHVPATLPDLLKTNAVVRWEYRETLGDHAASALASFDAQLVWLKQARSDYEIALPLHELTSFTGASGYWAGLDRAIRLEQLDHLIALCDEFYPSLRLHLFDAHRVYSAPVTVYGSICAAVYLGQHYLVFRDAAKVAAMSQHFDWLVRKAGIGARDVADYLRSLRAGVA